MSKYKLTPWYEPDVLPVRPGVYEVDYENKVFNEYQYFDGVKWWYGDWCVDSTLSMFLSNVSDIRYYPRRWRGVLKD